MDRDFNAEARAKHEGFTAGMLQIVDDESQPSAVRARASELIAEVHAQVSAIPATDDPLDRVAKTTLYVFNATWALNEVITPTVTHDVVTTVTSKQKVEPEVEDLAADW